MDTSHGALRRADGKSLKNDTCTKVHVLRKRELVFRTWKFEDRVEEHVTVHLLKAARDSARRPKKKGGQTPKE